MKYSRITKYKYRLEEAEIFHTRILGRTIEHKYFLLSSDGRLVVREGYLWDGVSGPTYDSKNTMRPGLGHDAKYHMIRLMLIPLDMKPLADKEFKQDLLSAGVVKFRAAYYYQAVKLFGASSCVPGNTKTTIIMEC